MPTTSKSNGELARARKARARKDAKALRNDYVSRTVLAKAVQRFLRTHNITQTRGAKIAGDAATQFSRLMNGHFAEFSAERLIGFLIEHGHNVDIAIRVPKAPYGPRGRVKIVSLPKSS